MDQGRRMSGHTEGVPGPRMSGRKSASVGHWRGRRPGERRCDGHAPVHVLRPLGSTRLCVTLFEDASGDGATPVMNLVGNIMLWRRGETLGWEG